MLQELKDLKSNQMAVRFLFLFSSTFSNESLVFSAFTTPKARYSTLLSDAPGAIQEAQQVQDAQVNDLSKVVADLDAINTAMDTELRRQTTQLENMHKQADKSLHNTNSTTYRLARLK